MACCPCDWFRFSSHDTLQDRFVLGSGVLLRILCSRTQQSLGSIFSLYYTKWVHSLSLPSCLHALMTLLYRLWIVVPTFIVLQLGKDLTESLTFAARESKKISAGKSK